MKKYRFRVELEGIGDDEKQAWRSAVSKCNLDPDDLPEILFFEYLPLNQHPDDVLGPEDERRNVLIQKIDPEHASEIIDNCKPVGRFFVKYTDCYVGIDNSTGEAWTESFDHLDRCIAWLRGDFEIKDIKR